MDTVRKYGKKPYNIVLLHGGPGAAGEMKPVAERLSSDFGVLELLQTKKTIDGQVEEVLNQLITNADFPVTMIGYSWGAWLAILFTSLHKKYIKKLILISAGSLSPKYQPDITQIRLKRLNEQEREEANRIMEAMNSGKSDNKQFARFGQLMNIADSYSYEPIENDKIEVDIEINRKVWFEARSLRECGELLNFTDHIKCPVVVFHGDHDPHPLEGVKKPLSERLERFRFIKLKQCGHTPWNEKYARENFFDLLRKSLII
jgi:pimeloyl-ACP methyl ester carboxylesterase